MDKIPGRRPDDIKADIRSRIEDHLTKLNKLQKDALKNLSWEKRENFDRKYDVFEENKAGENHGLPGVILFCHLKAGEEKHFPIYGDYRYRGGRMAGTLAFPPLPEDVRNNGRINFCINREHVYSIVWDSYLFPMYNHRPISGINLDSEKAYYDEAARTGSSGLRNLIPVLRKPDMSCMAFSWWPW